MNPYRLEIDGDSMKTRVELVTDAIRQAILLGRFHPGDRLDQTDLADELKVSRSPVREALRILTAEDLVTHYRHRGTIVTERSVKELEEILYVRKLLEGAAARRATPHISDTRLSHLGAILEEADPSQSQERLLELNNTFHTTIYEAYEQPYLISEIQKMRNKMAPYNRLYIDTEEQKRAAWQDHRRIYAACVERDGEKVAHETCEHLERVLRGIISSLDYVGKTL